MDEEPATCDTYPSSTLNSPKGVASELVASLEHEDSRVALLKQEDSWMARVFRYVQDRVKPDKEDKTSRKISKVYFVISLSGFSYE